MEWPAEDIVGLKKNQRWIYFSDLEVAKTLKKFFHGSNGIFCFRPSSFIFRNDSTFIHPLEQNDWAEEERLASPHWIYLPTMFMTNFTVSGGDANDFNSVNWFFSIFSKANRAAWSTGSAFALERRWEWEWTRSHPHNYNSIAHTAWTFSTVAFFVSIFRRSSSAKF